LPAQVADFTNSLGAVLGSSWGMDAAASGAAAQSLVKGLAHIRISWQQLYRTVTGTSNQQQPGSLHDSEPFQQALSECCAVTAAGLGPWEGPLGLDLWLDQCPELAVLHSHALPSFLQHMLPWQQQYLRPSFSVPDLRPGAAPGAPDLQIGRTSLLLGKGTYGSVFQGWCLSSAQPVAIKQLSSEMYMRRGYGSKDKPAAALELFHRVVQGSELGSYQRCAAAGGHPNVLALLGWRWEEGSSSYLLVLPLVASCVPALPLPREQAVGFGRQVRAGRAAGLLGCVLCCYRACSCRCYPTAPIPLP
jgi:hypothetical protein